MKITELRTWLSYDLTSGEFCWLRTSGKGYAGAVAGTPMAKGYIAIRVRGTSYLAHRLAWAFTFDAWPPEQIDHINGIKTDNRICNLRLATNRQNHANRGPQCNNTSGHKGVYWFKPQKTWKAQIQVNGRILFLGYFKDKRNAVAARRAADKKYQGEFAYGEHHGSPTIKYYIP